MHCHQRMQIIDREFTDQEAISLADEDRGLHDDQAST
jgi:hypothetical protein